MTQAAAKSKPAQLSPKIGMTAEERRVVAEKLGVALADSYVLFAKTQGVHWNVTGPTFYGLHKLTEAQYGNLYEAIDTLAERMRALGARAPAGLGELQSLSAIDSDERAEPKSVEDMIGGLVADHEQVVRSMREAIEPCQDHRDFVTADLLTARMAWHEEAIWMLRSLLG
jgi:starvation-inducible DNA-binding protein